MNARDGPVIKDEPNIKDEIRTEHETTSPFYDTTLGEVPPEDDFRKAFHNTRNQVVEVLVMESQDRTLPAEEIERLFGRLQMMLNVLADASMNMIDQWEDIGAYNTVKKVLGLECATFGTAKAGECVADASRLLKVWRGNGYTGGNEDDEEDEADADFHHSVKEEVVEAEGHVEPDVQPGTPAGGQSVIQPSLSQQDDGVPGRPKKRYPPHAHPIWGVGKMMDGICLTQGPSGTWSYSISHQPVSQRKNALVRGHNGLEPGDWFPFQINAVLKGAHREHVAGIAYDASNVNTGKFQGAFSVVVSEKFKALNNDSTDGDSLWYSGPESIQAKADGGMATTERTKGLIWCYHNKQPVRVLRKAGGGPHSPAKGLRYDGLYMVGQPEETQNKAGGSYMHCQLTRVPEDGGVQAGWGRPEWKQPPLHACIAKAPKNGAQWTDNRLQEREEARRKSF
jgi:hypothetical protein